MAKNIIFELKIDSKHSIIALEKKNYNDWYVDSFLYFKMGCRKIKIGESSFCEGFGLDMYYRMYNLKEFNKTSSEFAKELINSFDNQTYDENDFLNLDKDPYFNHKFVSSDRDRKYSINAFLFKKNNEYVLLFMKFQRIAPTRKHKGKIWKEFHIDNDRILEWKNVISAEWEKRTRFEGEEYRNLNLSDEEWEKHFIYMRSDD